ncbi:hypothetical protein PG995_003444 [Apiospora arundinis]
MDTSSAKNPELFSMESRAAAVIVGVTVLLLIPSAAVALRFYTRRALTGRVSYDDWISLVALNLGFACGITIAYMTRVGLGHHIGTITQSQGITEYLKAFYLSVVFYNAGIMFVKLSFLAMYYRAMKAPRWRRVVALTSVLVFAWEVTQVFAAIFFCRPFPTNRDGTSGHVKCIPYLPEWYQNTAGNIILNTIILLLSIPMVRSMKLPRVQKLALSAIFCLGLFTLATSIIRIRFLGLYLDTTFDNVDAAMWSLCEISSGLTCACLPTLRPLAARYFPRQFSYERNGVVVINRRRGMTLPPPLPLHQRLPIWYGADSPELRFDTGGGPPLTSGKALARSISTEFSATSIGEDDRDHEMQQQKHKEQLSFAAELSPKAHYGPSHESWFPPPVTTTAPQRPPLSRLISAPSSRRHSSPDGPDRTEIIIIGLQCEGESNPVEGSNLQQPDSVYRGWRNSDSGIFGPQHQGPREMASPTATEPVPAVPYWYEERNVPLYLYPDSPTPPGLRLPRRSGTGDGNNHVVEVHHDGYEAEGGGGGTTCPEGPEIPAAPDARNTAQWYTDAGRLEANVEGNRNRVHSFWRWLK